MDTLRVSPRIWSSDSSKGGRREGRRIELSRKAEGASLAVGKLKLIVPPFYFPFPPPPFKRIPLSASQPVSLFLSSSRLTFVMLALRQLVEGKVAPAAALLLSSPLLRTHVAVPRHTIEHRGVRDEAPALTTTTTRRARQGSTLASSPHVIRKRVAGSTVPSRAIAKEGRSLGAVCRASASGRFGFAARTGRRATATTSGAHRPAADQSRAVYTDPR